MFKFDAGNRLGVTATGKEFGDFKNHFENDDRGFGYIRIKVSDTIQKSLIKGASLKRVSRELLRLDKGARHPSWELFLARKLADFDKIIEIGLVICIVQ